MEIKNTDGKVLLTVNVDDESYRYREIMGDNSVTLKYSLAEHVELPVGCYIEFQTERYTLLRPESLKMIHTRDFEYTVTFESEQAKTGMWKFRNTVDGRLKFPLTAKPNEHLKMLVDNLNARETGWTMGDCIDGTETLISYDHLFCLDALKQMAETFNTEYEFEGKRVSLRRVEYNKDTPLDLQYGHGKGFKTGIERANSGETAPVEILFIQGGTRNIDPSKYGASELHLPKSTALAYDGTKFEDEAGYRAADARHYITDGSGLSVRRSDKALSSKAEDSLDCSSVYPSRVGTVSEVVVVDASKNFYDIVDPSIPDTLDYGECLIAGETMTVVFQSGELSGREFDVKYYHKAVSGKKAKRFEIVPAEQDGQTMPGGTFLPKAGDTYAVFHCQLPAAYINDTKTKTGAEWDMYRKAVKYMYDNEEAEFSFTGDLDGLWAKKDWENIGGRIKLGGYVRFTDERFQKTPVLVRITGIKDYINDPHSPEIDLSNKTVSGGVSTRLSELESQSVEIEETRRESIAYTQRRYRDALETMGLLEQSLLDNYTNSINPIAIQTMQLLVGDESLQFRFVNNVNNPREVSHTFTYNKTTKQLSTAAGVIQHMTLGIDSLSNTHAASDYKYWSVGAFTSAVLDDPSKKYYLYIKASKTATTAVFRLSETAIKMEAEAGYYNFLCGVLNSEYDGERSFATMYGFTEILPGRVTTDRVVSGNGLSFFDLLANVFKLGDRLRFNTDGKGQLVLNGTLVQRGDTEQPIIIYRGQWSASVAYTVNDVVFYQDGNKPLSSYTCIKDTTAGIAPTNATYWQPFAQGVKGDMGADGSEIEFIYLTNTGSQPSTPTSENRDDYVPQGWSDNPSGVSEAKQYEWVSVRQKPAGKNTVWGAFSKPVVWSKWGEKGQDGYSPALVFRGVYDNTKTYYGTQYRVDAVKYQNTYYVARVDAETFSGVVPTNTDKWNTFGGQFESIATNLLLAEGANIGDWFISNGKIVSTLDNGNKIELDAKARKITIYSQQTGGAYIDKSEATTIKTTLTLDADSSVMRVENNNGVAYISSAGIFANRAGTQCVSSTTGFTHKAAICGLGFANQNKSAWEFDKDENLVAGVYGNADNKGTAPSYGGFFYNLRVNGLILNTKYVEKTGVYLEDSQTYIIGLSTDVCNVYLPASSRQGQTVVFKQLNTGTMRVYARSGQQIWDDITENDYYDCSNGQMLTATFTIFYVTNDKQKTSTKVEAWLVNRMKF